MAHLCLSQHYSAQLQDVPIGLEVLGTSGRNRLKLIVQWTFDASTFHYSTQTVKRKGVSAGQAFGDLGPGLLVGLEADAAAGRLSL